MKRILKYTLVIVTGSVVWGTLCFFATTLGWWHKPITDKKDTESFIRATKKEINSEFVGNFAMAVIKEGKVQREVFHSVGKKVDKNTIFQVASLSKFVSAVGVMKLQELGKIDIDAPVSQYLTRWQLPPSEFDNNLVTARRLLSHTAGLTDGLGYSGFENIDSVQTLEASLTKATDADEGRSGEVKVGIAPNSSWIYSGGGFTLLQLLVEETSGQSFDNFMKNQLFSPLNMMNSSYQWTDSINNNFCEFYNTDGTNAPHFFYTSLAATSLYTSLGDLEKFTTLFFNKETLNNIPLSEKSLNLMQKPHWNMMGAPIYGLGTFLYANLENNTQIIGHDGQSTPPINTAFRINPKTGNGIIILETGNPNLATRLASDWVFINTGKVDPLLFAMLQDKMVNRTMMGSLLITVFSIITGIWRKRRKRLSTKPKLH